MAKPLTALEAYRAAMEDVHIARIIALETALASAADHPVSGGVYERTLRKELLRRWNGRITAGELPPILS